MSLVAARHFYWLRERLPMELVGYVLQGLTALFTGSTAIASFMMRKRPRWEAFTVSTRPLMQSNPRIFVRIDNVGSGTAYNVRTGSNHKSEYRFRRKLQDKMARVDPGESIELEIEGAPMDPKHPLAPMQFASDTTVEVTWSQPPFWNHRKTHRWLLTDLEVDD